MKKLAVIGATGLLGQPVTNELLKAGYELTLLARNPEKAQHLWGSEVKVIKGDLNNVTDLQNLLQQQEGLYINLSVAQGSSKNEFQPEREGLQNILQVAKQLNIKRIGYVSSIVQRYQGMDEFDWWIFDLKNDAVNHVKNSGIPSTIFYPSTFMDNFDRGSYKQGHRILLAGKSLHPMYFIASQDFGKQVAVAFQNDTSDHKEYDIQGLEPFTANQAANVFVTNYPKSKLSIAKAPVALLKFLGNFSRKMNYGSHIVTALNHYPELFSSENTWAELGKPTITLAEYAKGAM